MTEVVLQNTKSHVVSSGKLKIGAGRAKCVDNNDPDAKIVAAYAGVNTLSPGSDEANAALDPKGVLSGVTSEESNLGNVLAEGRNRLAHIAVSAPLQVVVGEDTAPLGPPTGTVSTKAIEAAKDAAHAAAFGPGEAHAPVDAEGRVDAGNANTVAQIHDAQAEGFAQASEVAKEIADAHNAVGHSTAEDVDRDDVPEEDPLEGKAANDQLPKPTLQAAARFRGLDDSGTKPELADRINAHDQG